METGVAIDSIRVVRAFADRPLPDEALRKIVDAGRRAGSSKNLQRWHFIVVRDRDRLQALSETGGWAGHLAGAAAGIALVTPDPLGHDQPLSVMWDLGRAAQNMVLRAWDLGIGSCPATVYEHGAVRAILQLPEDRHCEYILSFGYPADAADLTRPKQPGGRQRLNDVVMKEVWEQGTQTSL
jgi:nitroreductase